MNGANRFRDNRELLHSIDSVRAFAPWARRIFVVAADGQRPDWYSEASYPDVSFVGHGTIFDRDGPPVFNSHAVEAVLHRIPDLAERFLYFNDDMFLGAPTQPSDFFTTGGRAVIRTGRRITRGWQGHAKAWRTYRGNVLAIMQRAFGPIQCFNTAHQAAQFARPGGRQQLGQDGSSIPVGHLR